MTSIKTASTAIRITLVIAILLAILAPAAAIAGTRCPGGGTTTPDGCSYQIDRDTTCAWPMHLMRVELVAWITNLMRGGPPMPLVRVGLVTMCIRLGISQ